MPIEVEVVEVAGAALDHRWWPAVARQVVEMAARRGLPPGDLRGLLVLAPRLSDAPLLRQALQALQPAGTAWVVPQITTLPRWAGGDDAFGMQRLVELYDALRASGWARSAFGSRPGALWALAAELAQLGDELTLAAVGEDAGFEGRWSASVQRHFRRRAARTASAHAQLVLQIWKAHASDRFGAGRLLKGWAAGWAARAGGTGLPRALAVLAPFGLPAWQRVLLDALAPACPVRVIEGDLAAVVSDAWPQVAWPELVATAPGRGIATMAARGDAARGSAGPALRILPSDSLEHEAESAAMQVIDWLGAGASRIALVALDRLAARRVRALLERAQVLVADQSGWKLSTTSAAAAAMRLLDLVVADFRVRDLLDWLRSPFAWHGRPERLAAAALIDTLASRQAVIGGLASLERLLSGGGSEAAGSEGGPAPGGDGWAAARAIVTALRQQAQALRAAATPERLAQALSAAIDALGMRAPLAADPIGADVIDEFERLRARLAGLRTALSLPEFRELLARHFENANATDPSIESPVVMTSLAGACLRPFDAVLLIGAGAEHLPQSAAAGTLMSGAVRRDLGLPTDADAHALQLRQLALLLATAPRSAATWRRVEGDEPRPLSAWLDRLCEIGRRAGWPELVEAPAPPARRVEPQVAERPAPRAPGRLPARLSAGACQSLVDCPYQFYGRLVLGLRRRDPLEEVARKRDLGVALHAIVHRLHRAHGEADLARMSDRDLESELMDYADREIGHGLRQRPALVAYRQRLRELIPGYVAWLRTRAGQGWRLDATESDFEQPFELDGGRRLALTGRIDRVEAGPDGTLQLIDLKVRTHTAVKADAGDPAEAIQLPFYALAVPQASAALYLSFERQPEPLKRVAKSVREFPVAPPLRAWADALAGRMRSALSRIDAGAPMAALGTEADCRYCEMRGLCRRAEWSGGA